MVLLTYNKAGNWQCEFVFLKNPFKTAKFLQRFCKIIHLVTHILLNNNQTQNYVLACAGHIFLPFFIFKFFLQIYIFLHNFKINIALKTLILTFRIESQFMTARWLSRQSNMSTIAHKTLVLGYRLEWNLYFIVWGLLKKRQLKSFDEIRDVH